VIVKPERKQYQEIKVRLNQQLSKLPQGNRVQLFASGNSWVGTSAISIRSRRPCRAGRSVSGRQPGEVPRGRSQASGNWLYINLLSAERAAKVLEVDRRSAEAMV